MIRLNANGERTGDTDFACRVCGRTTRAYALVTEPWPHHIDLCADHMTEADVLAVDQ